MSTSTPDWFEQGRRLVAGLAENVGAAHQHGSAADTRSCPVCAARAAWRDRRPDLLEGLADVLASTAEVLRASAARATPDGSAAGEAATPGTTPDTTPDPPSDPTTPAEETVSQQAPTPSPVQRIDVA